MTLKPRLRSAAPASAVGGALTVTFMITPLLLPRGRIRTNEPSSAGRRSREGVVSDTKGRIRLRVKRLRRHLRIWIALGVCVATFFLVPAELSLITRLLIGWNCGVTLFLVTIYLWMMHMTPEQISAHYIEEDPSAPLILIVATAAALLSVVAIIEPMATLRHGGHGGELIRFALAPITLINSWLLVPTMFTMHYADMFYSAASKDRPLAFPQTEMPAFWDFAYFSFTISAACQTADVATTRVAIRRVVTFHEIVSFAFNVAILGFAINITAGLISS